MIGSEGEPGPAPFRVLIVSDGDISRGPAVHRVLRTHLRTRRVEDAVVLASAGVGATSGQPMHPYTARALTEISVDPRDHVSHRISERRLAQAHLVLTVSRSLRRPLIDLRGTVRDRTFTVIEFARLAAQLEPLPDLPGGLVAAAADACTAAGSVTVDDDLDDVAAGNFQDHERLVRQVDSAVRDVSRVLSACLREPVTRVA